VATATEGNAGQDVDHPAIADGRYVVLSVDGHAGAQVSAYRNYLPSRLHDAFDAWAAAFENPFDDLVGGTAYRNWDSARRLDELAEDGVVAEVLFPNTIPPFYPSGNLVAQPPRAGEHELRWEGLKAHNRWMADFCADTPGRRAGLVQILLHDVDAAVKEIEWGKEAGLFGGVLLPGIPPDSGLEPFISPVYEPIWDVCEQLDMPLNHHAANAGPDYGAYDATMWMFMIETGFFSHRALWMLIFAGVFERHPKLKLVLTEGGAEWVPGVLELLDYAYYRVTVMGRMGSIHQIGHLADNLPLKPSEYYKRNVWIGSSFTTPKEAKVRHDIGVDRIMWGNDYPHTEATFPYTREALRYAFHDVDPAEVAAILGGNAAQVYPFDMELLRRVAVDIGAPTVPEIQRPLEHIPEDATSQAFEHLAPARIW
jgi:predicted TIM-barrel fold metal-dependent hydrolase